MGKLPLQSVIDITTVDLCLFNRNRVGLDKAAYNIFSLIELIPDEAFTKAFPLKLGSTVLVKLENGKVISKSATNAPWDAGDHPSDEDLYNKFKGQIGEKAETIWNTYLQRD